MSANRTKTQKKPITAETMSRTFIQVRAPFFRTRIPISRGIRPKTTWIGPSLMSPSTR